MFTESLEESFNMAFNDSSCTVSVMVFITSSNS